MAYNTNGNNNNSNSSDKPKADAWCNITAVCKKDGTEVPVNQKDFFNSPLYKNTESALIKALLERAEELDGELEVTLKAKIVIVNNKPQLDLCASEF